mmetsp:Transcript_10873/g.30855  ORF Transcript_10873/g.30855 Transcript_10873/m.30855 type:complete len:200 (+) Transcript_10873:473-1072(+)
MATCMGMRLESTACLASGGKIRAGGACLNVCSRRGRTRTQRKWTSWTRPSPPTGASTLRVGSLRTSGAARRVASRSLTSSTTFASHGSASGSSPAEASRLSTPTGGRPSVSSSAASSSTRPRVRCTPQGSLEDRRVTLRPSRSLQHRAARPCTRWAARRAWTFLRWKLVLLTMPPRTCRAPGPSPRSSAEQLRSGSWTP